MAKSELFLSTPSARRATGCPHSSLQRLGISIHALREEGDAHSVMFTGSCAYFYPRPPRGGRRILIAGGSNFPVFLSTPSARRATPAEWRIYRRCGISIHALREEGDDDRRTLTAILAQFLSTPSARRATQAAGSSGVGGIFLSTPSARRAT